MRVHAFITRDANHVVGAPNAWLQRREPMLATSQETPYKGCYRRVRCKPLLDFDLEGPNQFLTRFLCSRLKIIRKSISAMGNNTLKNEPLTPKPTAITPGPELFNRALNKANIRG